MRIGLDVDGVIYPWHEEIYRYFQENCGYTETLGEFWANHWGNLTSDEEIYYVSIPFLYNSTTPRNDVLTYVPKLAEIAELFYITARGNCLQPITRKFFDTYELPFKENLIFSEDKANYVRLLRIDYFLDDLPHNVDSLKSITNAYLFKGCHNRRAREGYSCVGSIKEFYEIVGQNV